MQRGAIVFDSVRHKTACWPSYTRTHTPQSAMYYMCDEKPLLIIFITSTTLAMDRTKCNGLVI